MSLKEKILEDFKIAFKEKKESEKSVLSMLKAEIKNREIELVLKEKDLSDDEVVGLMMRMVKQRKESAESYEKGGREDLASKEREEAEIISKYLPAQLSEEEIEKELKEIIESQNIGGKSDLGKLMGMAMGKLKGKAEGGKIKQAAERLLG